MSKYIRKTRDTWNLLGNYGYGFDLLTSEISRKEINNRLKEYRQNAPNGIYKIEKKREKYNQIIR